MTKKGRQFFSRKTESAVPVEGPPHFFLNRALLRVNPALNKPFITLLRLTIATGTYTATEKTTVKLGLVNKSRKIETSFSLISGVDTGGSGGSMNRGPRAPGGPERRATKILCNGQIYL